MECEYLLLQGSCDLASRHACTLACCRQDHVIPVRIDHVSISGFMVTGSCISPLVATLRQIGRRAMLWGRGLGGCTPSRMVCSIRNMIGPIVTFRTEGFIQKYAMAWNQQVGSGWSLSIALVRNCFFFLGM